MMQEVFDKLRGLQDILSKKYEIEREIYDIPKALNTKSELLSRLKKGYLEKNEKMELDTKKIAQFRIQLQDAENTRESSEKKMDEISTQREYEALDKEIKEATEREQDLRKAIVREERMLEELKLAIESDEAMIKTQQTELEAEEAKIQSESELKRAEIKSLEKEEELLVPDLDSEIVFKFERIIKNKAGLGIVPIKQNVCTGCHMILPAQFANDVRKGSEIQFCPYCSRVLFFEEEIVQESFMDESEAGSLADLVDDDELLG